ncbi:unnamed protein product [Rotaria magnacalcarata]|uniref:Uncharacterized protein n=1 Tax=Rotaria magnacalcarata TaxID=392030 RepID=A0A816XBF7_9BILA|nr:unnamed protein product [Rotaria magnacalcarata]
MSSTMTKGKTSKQISCKVLMLDDQELPFHIDPKATGQDLFTTVCNYIDLLENDYFALEFLDSHRNTCWLEMDKPVLKQVAETKFSFCVKFYTPDPGQLEEEFTRYLFAMQIKRDLHIGTLLCSDNTAALLASYIVQAEIGDYLESYNNNPSYLGGKKFFPHQTAEHEIRIMNFHKNHVGQLSADADLNLLDIARKVELYGIKMHPAKDHEQVNLNLSVAHMGILVFQNITKINTFSWAKIRKLSFKRKKFLIKLQPEGYGYYKDTVEFYFDTRDECKNFWKKCIEYHAFFRCVTIKRTQRSRSKLLTRGSSFRYNGRTQKEVVEYAREHYVKNRTFTRSYSNTRAVAPATNRASRSPGTALKTSDTMRSHDTNLSSTDSTRHQTRPIGISVTSTTTATTKNQPTTTTITTITDATVSTTPNDIYQHVYHDDSSTHGSRTLDSRFSRDKYDLSGASTDEDHDEEQQNIPNQSNEQTQQPMNGSVSSSPPRPPPTSLPIPQPTSPIKTMPILDKPITDIEQSINSKRENELHELDKSKSPGIENILCTHVHDDEEEEEEEEEKEDNSESNHKTENRVCVEIYHNDNNKNSKNEENKDENEPVKRYSTSLKMYLSTRNSAGGSHSICVTPNVTDLMNKKQEDEQQKLLSKRSQQQQQRSHSLQIERTLSIDLTHSPSSSSSSSSLLEPPNAEYLIGSNICDDNNGEYLRVTTTPPMVIEIRSKPHSLPRMTNYIEYVDRRTLPPINSLSWQDDTITNDQIIPLYEKESPEDSMELVRQVIESILTQIVEEERQLIATVDRLVEQACSRAISLYIMECRAQLFAGSSHVPHHKSCILRAVKTDKNHDNDSNANNLASRLRTKSSPVITTTTDWTDVSRKLAAQTCFAAFPSGNNIHELNRSDFSTFSDAKLKFFNIISNDVVPSQSSISLPPLLSASFAPNVVSSSSSTRSSRASSTSSYASSMHVPCPPVIDSHLKRYQRPLSARLLDLSDDSDSNPTASISTSLKTCIIPTTVSNPNPSLPPPVRAQRRLQQQQKRRSTEDLNSSSDDSLSNHLNKAAGDSITTGQQQYRREISGFVNNHRPVPPITSSTPPGRSSITTEQQLISVAQRPSLSKQAPIINNENGEISSPNKRSSIGENILPISPALKPFINKTTDETNIDDNKTRTIPIIHEYRSPTTTLSTIESRTRTTNQQSPSRANPSTFYSMNQQIAGIPRLIGSVSLPPTSLSTHFPTSLSSTMIISPLHDRAFFICKELLMTERTYKKDIEVVADNFRRELMLIINEQNDIYLDQDEQQQQQKNLEKDSLLNLSDLLFTHLVPIYNFHVHFLRQLEQRISLWENRSIPGNEYGSGETTHQHIGDLITNLVEILPTYENYVESYDRLLCELEYVLKYNRRFDLVYKEFESQKFCYLSFISFLLKPLQRLLHYEYLLEKLLKYYRQNNNDMDYQDCYGIYIKIQDHIENFTESLTSLLNRQKLIELQRDLIGVDNLSIQHDRQFIREGCLQKLSRKGYQQRMFFLFSDVLLYCARSSSPILQFKLHGELPLKLMTVEDSDERTKIPNSISIYTGTRSLLVAASSETEKNKWLNDLVSGIENIKSTSDEQHKNQYTSTLKSNASSENLDYSVVGTVDEEKIHQIEPSCIQHRANTTMHVCWHRNLSVSMNDHRQSIRNQLSGYLLRKFKNSNGWQKLWVVFTNFCLFFYKTYQDDFPLASLPLLGYRSSLPSETDGVNKDFVFKLQFKNHVYFFRAESQYAFDRWMEVVSSTTISSTNPTCD